VTKGEAALLFHAAAAGLPSRSLGDFLSDALTPESNPVEQVWAYLRANFLSHRVWDGYEAIVEACCDAWNRLMNTPERLASMTRRAWAKAVTG
jgi:hypothetical protein